MKKIIYKYLFMLMIVFTVTSSYGQEKIAQTGFNFLSISSDARATAMGDAVNSFQGFSGALSYNPASMADIEKTLNGNFSVNQWIADINHISSSLILKPFDGDLGTIGLSFQAVDYGDIQGTIVANNAQGYIDTKKLSPTAFAIGIAYAKSLNDQFSVGGQIRYAHQELGESIVPDGEGTRVKDNKAHALAYDFGTVYKTGIKSIAFGMSIRNFSTEVKYEEEDFQLPLLFTIGISADLFDFINIGGPKQELLLSFDSTHPRSQSEQIKVGIEYGFMDMVFLRGGFVSGNSEDDFSFGFGLAYMGVDFDYAYTPFGVFDNVQRFTARVSL